MSRTAMVLLAGLAVVGCVVALLPAQESSRRTASKYRSGSEPPPRPTEAGPPPRSLIPPAAAPESLLPPNMLPANLQQQLQAASQQVTQEMAVAPTPPAAPSAFAPAALQAMPGPPASAT